MKAIQIDNYGGRDVLQVREIERPKPKAGEILVRVHSCSVNPIDWKLREGQLKLFMPQRFPLILGADLAGEVVECGEGATRFKPGDRVYAILAGDVGAYAQFVAFPETIWGLSPKEMSWDDAASVPAVALTALQSLRDKASLQRGQRLLVNGASGGVGIFAVQLGKVMGAEVTAVCSAEKAEMVLELGADRCLDYRKVDFTAEDETYDVVFDCAGKSSFAQCAKILHKHGVYITTLPSMGQFARQLINPLTSKKAQSIIVQPSSSDLDYITSLFEQGRLKTIVDRVFPMAEVGDAHDYSASGEARGKIVLSME